MYNNCEISGQITKIYPIRYTLQNIPIVSFVLSHESIQLERKHSRNVKCRMFCVYIEDDSLLNINLINKYVKVVGFISLNGKSQLVLHVKKIDFLDKGN